MVSTRLRVLTPAAALLALALAPAAMAQADAPLPNPPEFPEENPPLPDQDTLGKFLFWEEQLSSDNTMSCGTCHIHEAGGSDPRAFDLTNPGPDGILGTADDVAGSPGVVPHDLILGEFTGSSAVQTTGRKSPTTINSVYFNQLFWDGRASQTFTDPSTGIVEIAYLGALESQAAGPPLSEVEMTGAGRDWNDIAAKIAGSKPMALATNLPPEMVDFLDQYPTYPDMFEAVYGDPAVTPKRIIFAIANYERTLISDDTVLDKWLKGEIEDFSDYDPKMQQGFDLFQGNANCATCHTLPFTHDNDFHNVGVRPDAEDLGLFVETGNPADIGKFKTAQVRNAKLRDSMFHNGGIKSVEELVRFYDRGGDFDDGNLDPNILVLNLTEAEIQALTFFIEEGCTDPRVENGTFPFTRPTLRSELPPLNSTFGVESQDSLGGTASVIAHQPANLNNGDFLLGVSDAMPGQGAALVLTFLPGDGSPYPDPRFPVPVNVDLGTLILLFTRTVSPDGLATVKLPIPDNAVLAGQKFYGQWFINDPAQLATGGVYGTKGMEIEIF